MQIIQLFYKKLKYFLKIITFCTSWAFKYCTQLKAQSLFIANTKEPKRLESYTHDHVLVLVLKRPVRLAMPLILPLFCQTEKLSKICVILSIFVEVEKRKRLKTKQPL